MPSAEMSTRQRVAVRRGAERLDQPAVDQERRVDPVRQLAQLLNRLLDLAGQLVEHLEPCLRVVDDDVPGQAQVHRQRDEVLLRAVVQVPLDAATFGVAAGHDARPRLAERVGLLADLVQGRLQGGVELRVVQGQPDLPGQVGQDTVVVLGEHARLGRPLDHDQPEQFAGVADRRDPDLLVLAALRAARAARWTPTPCPTRPPV